MSMDIGVPATEATDRLVDLWVQLAESQRKHGTHIQAADNRAQIRESIVRHLVSDRLFAAQDDGIIGFVMFRIESESYEQDGRRGIVENLFVRAERRGEGIGAALLTAAERELTAQGVDVVALEVMADNDTARQFYRKQGYEPHRIELEKSVEDG